MNATLADVAPKAFQSLEARVRRGFLIVGIGLFSCIGGSILSAALLARLQPRLVSLPFQLLALGLVSLFARLWVLAVLPAVCYGAARVFPLRPWGTAIGAALAGEGFLLLIALVSMGLSGLMYHWVDFLVRLATLAGGVLLSARSIQWAHAAAEAARAQATQAAEEKKAEYAEFAREAERVAALHDKPAPAPAAPQEPQTPNE